MKNKFGFIPIVLPVLVMVLIIGLINLGGPQEAEAQTIGGTDPQLTSLAVTRHTGDGTDPAASGALVPADAALTQTDDDGGAFAATYLDYTLDVAYQVTSTVVVATPDGTNRGTVTLSSSPLRPSTATRDPESGAVTAVVPLRVGVNNVAITVRASSNSYSTYRVAITRGKPALAEAATSLSVGVNNGSDIPNQSITAFDGSDINVNSQLTDLTRPDGLTGFNTASTTYEVIMAYAVTSTVVQSAVADATTMEVSFSSRMAPSTTTRENPTAGQYNAIVPLGVGDNRIQIKVMGKGRSNEYQTYTVNVKRNRPVLTNLLVEANPGDTAFETDPANITPGTTPVTYSRFGPEMASTTLAGYLTGNPTQLGFISTTTDYMTSVEYDRTRIRVNPTPGTSVEVQYIGSRDADTDTGVYDMNLRPGVNTVTVRARGMGASNRQYWTDYDLTITRERTPLNAMAVSANLGMAPVLDPEFGPGETDYDAMVDYIATDVQITAEANTDTEIEFKLNDSLVTTTMGTGVSGTADLMEMLDLAVGDNDLDLKASIDDNSNIYSVTLKRKEPAPTLWFELLDSDGTPLSVDEIQLDLTSSDEPYTLDEDDGFSVDVHSVKIAVNLNEASASDVNVTLGRVEIPTTDTDGVGDDFVKHLLVPGKNTLPFDVEFRVKASGDTFSESRHEVTIDRTGNSVPTFRANHHLDAAPHDAFHDTTIEGSEQAIVLPYATGGNGRLEYRLVGIEADGTDGPLPEGLSYDQPGDRQDGQVTGKPQIEDDSDRAYQDLRWIVNDTDQVSGSADESSIDFTIVIYRDEAARDRATRPGAPAPGELIDLRVLHVDEYVEDDRKNCDPNDLANGEIGDRDCADLMPAFNGGRMSYTATVPTDIATVDIHAVATSSATVTLRGVSGTQNDLQTSATPGEAGATRHEWNGHRIRNGGSTENDYVVTVTEGTVVKEYNLSVVRVRDTRPVLPSDDKVTYRFFEGTMVDEDLDSASNGNGPEILWTYSIERRSSRAPESTMYLGLEFSTTTDDDDVQGRLMGRAKLDTDADLSRLAERSEVWASYGVSDADDNMTAGDKDSQDIDIIVYRDVRLSSYQVGSDLVEGLAMATEDIPSDWDDTGDRSEWEYSYPDVSEYVYTGLAYDADNVTFRAVANNGGATVQIMNADADTSAAGHQIALTGRNNAVTVKVTNGTMYATHVINLTRPGLFLERFEVQEDEGSKAETGTALKLDPKFDPTLNMYTADAPLWLETVKIFADAKDSRASVSVDGIKKPSAGFWEADLEAAGMDTTFVITVSMGATVGTQEVATTTLVISRASDSAPVFNPATVTLADKYEVGKMLSLNLPTAMGGNGEPTYSINEEELPPGLEFMDAAGDDPPMISGTPTLSQGYESEFDLIYKVTDQDDNTDASDMDEIAFTIVITHEPQPAEGGGDNGFGPGEDYNTLGAIDVTYIQGERVDVVAALSPAFDPTVTSYTVRIPHDATNTEISATPSHTGAGLRINRIRVSSGDRVILQPVTTIRVVPPASSNLADMEYTVTMAQTTDTAPSFDGVMVGAKEYAAGEAVSETLPAAIGGNGDVAYTLVDHEDALPKGLRFNAATRTLSGTPLLVEDADKTLYRMSYTATDENGDSDMVEFTITICTAGACVPPPANPGATPVDLEVSRSSDGMSATLTWRPGDDAAMQLVAAVDLNDIVASINATVDTVAGDADRYTFSGLSADVSYTYLVIGLDANGGYMDASTSSGISGMVVSE